MWDLCNVTAAFGWIILVYAFVLQNIVRKGYIFVTREVIVDLVLFGKLMLNPDVFIFPCE